jgi:hypothetical protein
MKSHMDRIAIKASLFIVLAAAMTGCGGSTNWKPVAEQICKKYEERLRILQGVKDKSEAAGQLDRIIQWRKDYEKLNDQLSDTVLQLRNSGGTLDFQEFDKLKMEWAKVDDAVIVELRRLNGMNGVGPDYDKSLGEFTRTTFSNPFR